MKLLFAFGCLLVGLPLIAAKELVKVGSEIDFTATALQTEETSACRAIDTRETAGLIGFALVQMKQSDAALKAFGETLTGELVANHWKIESNWNSGPSPSNGWPYQVFVRATREKATMELFVTFFFEPTGKTNISYSQRRSR